MGRVRRSLYARFCSAGTKPGFTWGLSNKHKPASSPRLWAGHKSVERGAPGRAGLAATAREGAGLPRYAGRLCGPFQRPSPPGEAPVSPVTPRHLPTALLIKPHKRRARNSSLDKYQAVLQAAHVTGRHESTGNLNTKTTGGRQTTATEGHECTARGKGSGRQLGRNI